MSLFDELFIENYHYGLTVEICLKLRSKYHLYTVQSRKNYRICIMSYLKNQYLKLYLNCNLTALQHEHLTYSLKDNKTQMETFSIILKDRHNKLKMKTIHDWLHFRRAAFATL